MARASISDDEDELPSLDILAKRAHKPRSKPKKLSAVDSQDGTASVARISSSSTTRKPRSAQQRYGDDLTGVEDAVTLELKDTKAQTKGAGAPLRRRKLGDAQAFDDTLFRKWSGAEDAKEGKAERRVRSREVRGGLLSRSNTTSSIASFEELFRSRLVREDKESGGSVKEKTKEPVKKETVPVPTTKKTDDSREARRQRIRKATTVISDDEEEVEESEQNLGSIWKANKHSSSESNSDSGSDSDFVTALDLDTESDSSSKDNEVVLPGRHLRSPSEAWAVNPFEARQYLLQDAEPIKSREAPTANTNRTQKEDNTKPFGSDSRTRRENKKSMQEEDLNDVFEKLHIFGEDSDEDPIPTTKPRNKIKLDKPETTMSPKKTLPPSPSKAPSIPKNPYEPEHGEFWDPEVQNKWIDQHSPQKPREFKKLILNPEDLATAAIDLKTKFGTSPEKRKAKKAFDSVKESLARRFLEELDDRVTGGQLGKLTTATGGIRIQWSSTLHSTAGRAHWKYKDIKTVVQQEQRSGAGSNQTTTAVPVLQKRERQHYAHIELATKVVANEADLLNTVAHEFCHLATFMLDGKPKFAHGPEFKAWGRRTMDAFGNRGIVVTTKHNYEIDYKYIWRCVECTTEVRRHSKSVDTVRQRCGRCKGILEQVKPVPRGSGGSGGATEKGGTAGGIDVKEKPKKTAYQEFVSKEMKVLKAEGKQLNFKEMMGEVSVRWKAHRQQQETAKDKGDAKVVVGTVKHHFEELIIDD